MNKTSLFLHYISSQLLDQVLLLRYFLLSLGSYLSPFLALVPHVLILVSNKILVLSNSVACLDAAMNFDMAYKKMDRMMLVKKIYILSSIKDETKVQLVP